MTNKQFLVSKWKPFEIMTVYVSELNRYCECYLVGIDFEDRIMKIRPLDVDAWEDNIYSIPIGFISRGNHRSKINIVK